MSAPNILTLIQQSLSTSRTPLLGCPRQNLWSPQEYRDYRGEALLAAVGSKCQIDTPYGSLDFYMYGPWVLQFRGGYKKPWWDEDVTLLCAIVSRWCSIQPDGVIIIQELDGKLSQYYVDAPSADTARALVDAAIKRLTAEDRISKSSPRASICRHCLVKKACDALDLERGQTQDWPKGYVIG
jgi:hypothetical protein